MAIVPGIGFLSVNDLLTDVSFALIEPPVNTSFPVNVAAGLQTVNTTDLAIYPGAMLVVGAGADLEVVTVASAIRGTSFTATFANAHTAGQPIIGATFPVRQPLSPFFTQPEMLAYVATAQNDFLVACPLIIGIDKTITVAPTTQNANLPGDCQKPVRVGVYGRSLRETSQSNLDSLTPRWQSQSPKGPMSYFRDKIGLLKIGIWPRANNTTPVEVIYERRGPDAVGLADGFLVPDPFVQYIKFRVLSFAYSKDGDQRNPGMAKYYAERYAFGVKLCNVFLEEVDDPNASISQ